MFTHKSYPTFHALSDWFEAVQCYKTATLATTTIFIVQALVAFYATSLALGADTIHVSSDLIIVALSWFITYHSLSITQEKIESAQVIFTWFAIVVLLLGAIFIFAEAWERLQTPRDVLSEPVLIVAAAGMFGNWYAHHVLHKMPKKYHDHVHKSAKMHVLTDLLASTMVIAAASLTLTTGWVGADAWFSFGIGLYIIYAAYQRYKDMHAEQTCTHNHH